MKVKERLSEREEGDQEDDTKRKVVREDIIKYNDIYVRK